jgi:hypothetical protein
MRAPRTRRSTRRDFEDVPTRAARPDRPARKIERETVRSARRSDPFERRVTEPRDLFAQRVAERKRRSPRSK